MDLITLSALCLGLTEVIKQLGVPSRFAPVISIIIGLGGSFIFAKNADLGNIVLNGLIAGLSASGFWSGAKAVAGK